MLRVGREWTRGNHVYLNQVGDQNQTQNLQGRVISEQDQDRDSEHYSKDANYIPEDSPALIGLQILKQGAEFLLECW